MKRTKKALAVVLSLSMLASITPQIVLANSNIPDRYEEVSEMQAIVKDAEVHAYVTRNGGTAELTDSNGVETTFTQGIGYREYTATPADGWVWKGWTYEQLYQGEDLGNRTDYGWGKRYSFSNDGSDWNSAYNGTGQTISVNRLLTKGETVGNKIIYNIYANFNPTINATAGTGGTITDNGVTEVNYGDSKQYDITADAGQDIASVSVDGQDISNAVGKDNFSYTFENVREPHTIDVTFTNELYTVTYTDGVEGQEIFKDEVYSDLKIGDVTPKFKGSLERKDYVFTGWNPEVTNKVAGTAVYTATWADDKNNNGTPDDKEEKFTVTYTDGVDNEEIFKDQSYVDLLSGTKTPKFNGEPKRTGYVFTGWTPEVTETVTQTVTYSAQWAVDENGNDKPDNDEKYTVSYQFINGADDKELPKEVNDMLPKATSYVYGVKVVPVALKADRVETTDGVWLFEGWTPEEIEKLTADTAFTGTWTFAKNAGGINHIPVITAEDKTLTVGDSFDVMAGVTALDKEDGDLNCYQRYYDDVLILLKTGLRISEFCGLTKHDLDFENHSININHQLLKNKDGYYINEPKTKSGIRKVPMSDETEKAFHRVLKRKLKPMIKEIDGYRHFLFLLENGCPAHNATYKTLLIRMIKKYNKTHDVPLPHITPHTLRHTFCTRLAQKNMNPKNLQYIMGHSNISITLNLYAHASEVGANKEMRSMIA